MNNLITAFFMAWGNFLNIPCPYRKWDEKLNKLMLTMLPLIGLIAGLAYMGAGYLLTLAPIHAILKGFAMIAWMYYITGLIHLDGFMDCADAVLSRRDLEERRRILKDSSIGAFAVISLVFLLLGEFAGLTAYMEKVDGWRMLIPLALIPIVSRGVAGASVLQYKPLPTSQYSESEASENSSRDAGSQSKPKHGKKVLAIAVLLALGMLTGTVLSQTERELYMIVISAAVTAVGTRLTAAYCNNSLKGMNGDIAGCSISVGELAGIITASVISCVM